MSRLIVTPSVSSFSRVDAGPAVIEETIPPVCCALAALAVVAWWRSGTRAWASKDGSSSVRAIGGALRMNAGANGVETRERVVSVRALDRQGNAHEFSNAEMGYAYRHSSAAPDLIFVGAEFEGYPEDREAIKAAMDTVQTHRETVQPIREKTGGSTFKNPEGTSAWKEVDKAGCRGLMIGGAQISPMHCNFMINTGTATGYDLEFLGETVRARVLENSGIRLEWEIKRIGAFRPGHEVQEFLGQML